jgi:hypothetical protein
MHASEGDMKVQFTRFLLSFGITKAKIAALFDIVTGKAEVCTL